MEKLLKILIGNFLVNSGSTDFWIYPNLEWKEMSLGKIDSRDFRIVEEMFLIDIKKVK